jgi:hypothetical protein
MLLESSKYILFHRTDSNMKHTLALAATAFLFDATIASPMNVEARQGVSLYTLRTIIKISNNPIARQW